MEVEPECPVCFGETFTDPVLLSCGHIVCWICLQETRRSDGETAKLCPQALCPYDKATPMYLSGTTLDLLIDFCVIQMSIGSLTMTPEQVQIWGERRAVEYEVDPSPQVTPPPTPRRSVRVSTPNPRFANPHFGNLLNEILNTRR